MEKRGLRFRSEIGAILLFVGLVTPIRDTRTTQKAASKIALDTYIKVHYSPSPKARRWR